MGIFRDAQQEYSIRANDQRASAAESLAQSTASKLLYLEERVEKAMMINEALWLIMKKNMDLSDEFLEEVVRAIDLQDGKLDGKVVRETQICGNCNRRVGSNRQTCIYCNAPIEKTVFE